MLNLSFRLRPVILRLRFAIIVGVGCNTGLGAPVGESRAELLALQVATVLSEAKADDRLKKLQELGSSLTLPQIPEALEAAKTLGELRARAVFQDAAVKRWAQLEPAGAWTYVTMLPEGRGKLELVRSAAADYAAQAPDRAAVAVASLNGTRSRIEAIALVAEIWAKSDVSKALQWVQHLPPGPAREAGLYSIRFIWVHADPAAASEDIRQVPPGDTRRLLIMNIAGEWAARDPQAALAWARDLSNPSEQEEAFVHIAESWADTDPDAAGTFALKLPPLPSQRAALAVIARWATQDPRAAALWALRRQDETLYSRGVSEALNVWTSVESDAAGTWIQSLPPGKQRDVAIQAYAQALAEWAPERAAHMALLMSEPLQRWTQIEDCLNRWAELDPVSARRWIEAAELPVEKKQAWLRAHGHG
jgi:hypothetical protein